jgi:hypothetical protein
LGEGDVGASAQNNLVATARSILERYEREGLFNVFEENGESVYRSRPLFRVQVRFMMWESEHRLLSLLQQMRATENRG